MKRRAMYPMPVSGLIDHPQFVALPAAGRGMVITLVLYYWQSECAPLPTKLSELFAVARANPQMWAKHRATILKIVNDVKPELETYFLSRKGKIELLRKWGALSTAKRKAARLAKNAPPTLAAEEAIPRVSAVPYQRVATPEERGPRAKVAPTKRG